MKQTKHWLVIAAVLLCSVTRISAEIILTEEDGLLATTSENEAGTLQYVYTSEVLSCDKASQTITFTFLEGHSETGALNDRSGYPFVAFAEFYLYDGEGNEIALTEECFVTNAQEAREGPMSNICDDDLTTFFHSTWSGDVNDYHKLCVNLPEGKELTEFKFKYITRYTEQCVPKKIKITTGREVIATGTRGENITWTFTSDGNMDIQGSGEILYNPMQSHHWGNFIIRSVTIPESVTSIGERAFEDCSSLTSITIPESVTSIGKNAFWGCSSLTSITIPESVTSIGWGAFWGCSSLTSITIPENVTSIGDNAFYGCSSLTSITLSESVKSIGECAFSQCSSLTSITIPESVTSIGEVAFGACSSLTSITIPKSVTSIERNTFRECYSLTSITLPESLTSIGEGAFYECSSLTSITLPESVTSIGEIAFFRCSSLASITIPKSVNSIGECAFSDCSSLTTVNILAGLTSIGRQVFSSCRSLTSITLPESLTSIGEIAFSDCSSLTSITIPKGVTSIGECAFSGCESLISIVVAADNTVYDSRDNCNAIVKTKANTLVVGCSTTVIPESVTSIGESAFNGCYSLTSITLSESLTSIGESAFYGCSSLTSITIPESVKSIGEWAFGGCTADLFINCNIPSYSETSGAFTGCQSSKVTIGSNVTSIGDYAFYNCISIESIIIPESVIEIGRDAFTGTVWYNNIEDGIENDVVYINKLLYTYKGTMPENTAITVKEGTTTINNSVFSGKKTLTAITLPGSITKIGERAFNGCSNLTSFDIPANAQLTSIGKETFSGCKALTTLVIPAKVTEIGSRAFYNCTGLTSITCYAEVPPTVDSGSRTASFSKVDTSIPLYVPIGSEAAYQAADGWKEFSNIIGVDTGIENLKSESTLPMIYDLSGRRVEDCTKSGIYIINGKKIVIK